MPTDATSNSRTGNFLLDLLPTEEVERLRGHLHPTELPFKEILYLDHDPIEFVYFMTSGVASALAHVGDGRAVEVASIGNEGLVGISAVLGPSRSVNKTIMQVGGSAIRMPAHLLPIERNRNSPLYTILVHYHSAYMAQVSQSVACNGLHTIKQRCCRWILMTHDRVQHDVMSLTHEFLSVMLGVRRASISEVLQPLQAEGMLRSERGEITILDRLKLESESCECYEIVVNEYDRHMGLTSNRSSINSPMA